MGDVLLYHYPCPDGVFSGLAAWLRLTADGRAVRIAPQVSYKSPAERAAGVEAAIQPGETVHLLDFSGGLPFILALCQRAQRVMIVDHHKTAREDIDALGESLPGNLEVHFDMARSGATMARDTYNIGPVLRSRLGEAGAARVLKLFQYIEDHDLWRHALPGSKEFAAGFTALGLELDASVNPTLWDTLLALDADALIADGAAVLAEQERIIEAEAAKSFVVAIPYGQETMRCLAAITTNPDLRSGLGNVLSERSAAAGLAAAGAVVYEEPGMGEGVATVMYKVSMRSIGDVDTSTVSRVYGGGGHRNASSFNIERATWAAWVGSGASSGPG